MKISDPILRAFYENRPEVVKAFQGAEFTRYGSQAAVESVETRMLALENATVPDDESVAATSGKSKYEYPFGRESLKREFMQEILAFLATHDSYRNVDLERLPNGSQGSDLLLNGSIANPGYGFTKVDGKETYVDNFDLDPGLSNLNETGKSVYKWYADLFDQILVAGDRLAQPPVDPATGQAAKTLPVLTTATPITYQGVSYTQISQTADNVYVLSVGDRSRAEKPGGQGDPVLTPSTILPSSQLVVEGSYTINQNRELVPDAGTNVTQNSSVTDVRYLGPFDYLYFWTEARVKVLRAKLAYEEGVVRELQEDLKQANAAMGELEKIAGSLSAQGPDNKVNTEKKRESLSLDLFESMHSTPDEQLFNIPPERFDAFIAPDYDFSTGPIIAGDSHNYAEWQQNRTNLKNYIDTRQSELQQASLDYQTTLNRFNQAYETMAKLQDKLQDLMRNIYRNF